MEWGEEIEFFQSELKDSAIGLKYAHSEILLAGVTLMEQTAAGFLLVRALSWDRVMAQPVFHL